jgi:hypothetical protein
VSGLVEGEGGNREVPTLDFFDARGDLSGAGVEANLPEEGGSWGKHGFPHGSKPKVCDEAAQRAVELAGVGR